MHLGLVRDQASITVGRLKCQFSLSSVAEKFARLPSITDEGFSFFWMTRTFRHGTTGLKPRDRTIDAAGADRSVLMSPFSSLQILNVFPDHSKLISSTSKNSGESDLWTPPVLDGDPARLEGLSGRDASWSANSKDLVFGKDSDLLVANGDTTAGDDGQPRREYDSMIEPFGRLS